MCYFYLGLDPRIGRLRDGSNRGIKRKGDIWNRTIARFVARGRNPIKWRTIHQELSSMLQRSGRRFTRKPSHTQLSTDRPATTPTAIPLSDGLIVLLSMLRVETGRSDSDVPSRINWMTLLRAKLRSSHLWKGSSHQHSPYNMFEEAAAKGWWFNQVKLACRIVCPTLTLASMHPSHKICRMSSCYQFITFISHHQLLRCRLLNLLTNVIFIQK